MFLDNNVKVTGAGERFMVFAHGFGCDQNMWRYVAPAFEGRYRVVRFDHVGAGRSNLAAFDPRRYASLKGYADDVLDICDHLGVRGGVFVGHSVSAMIGILAAIERPEVFSRLVLVGPSPCYINRDGYHGGFEPADIEGLLETLDSNHLGWSRQMAPVIMGNPDRPELAQELGDSFCRTDPDIARHFARTTFTSDHRAELPRLSTPSLILQCADDVIAPTVVGEYVHAQLPGSTLVHLKATGHCPNMSAPQEVVAAIERYLDEPACADVR
jgi:sigma-B regulation protein RsbQ